MLLEITVDDYPYQVDVVPETSAGGYSANVVSLPGCVTQGDCLQDVLEIAEDAIRCWLEAHDYLKSRGITVDKCANWIS